MENENIEALKNLKIELLPYALQSFVVVYVVYELLHNSVLLCIDLLAAAKASFPYYCWYLQY